MDPLAQKPTAKNPMDPSAFLGANSALVNLDNLIKPINNTTNNNPYNPFESPAMKTKNLFQQNQPQVSLKFCSCEKECKIEILKILESVHKSIETAAATAVPSFTKSRSMGACE